MIKIPAHITGAQPTGAPDTLRTVRPTFLAPALSDTRASAHAVGAHVIRLPRGMEARSSKLDGVPVLFARNGRQVHVLVDSTVGVVEVIGWSAEQVGAVHEWMDAAEIAPATELDAILDRIAARNPGRVDLDPADKSRDTKRALQLLGLSTGDASEVDRYLALSDELDDGATSGDSEVDRLARLADNLSDG